MQIPLQFDVILIGAIIAQGVFAALLLAMQRFRAISNRLLSVLVLLFALWLCDTFFRIGGVYRQNPNYYLLPIYYSFAFGPLVYFYTRSMTEQHFQFKLRDSLHFVPVVLQTSLYLFLQSQDYEFRRVFWFDMHRPYTYDLEFNLSLVSMAVYLFFSMKKVQSYQQWIANHFSELAAISLNWLKIVLGSLLGLAILWLLDVLLREWLTYYPNQTLSASFMGICILVFAGGALLQRPLSFSKINLPEKAATIKLAASQDIDQQLLERIVTEMEQHRHYLNPKLNLSEFAAALKLPPRIVSVHINQALTTSFIDFVNGYRVQAVKEALGKKENEHLSLLGIALESGFNSKSTFNRVFKKMTGELPSAYQKRVQNVN